MTERKPPEWAVTLVTDVAAALHKRTSPDRRAEQTGNLGDVPGKAAGVSGGPSGASGTCSCGNSFDGDNLCMPSACQWEGIK